MMQVGDVLMKFFNVTHEIVEEPSGFKNLLQETVGKDKTIPAFMPDEPICVAEMLINARKEHECSSLEKLVTEKDKYMRNMFGVSELRQIAEHLLVYCDANETATK